MKLPLSYTTAKAPPSPLQPRQSSGDDCGCTGGGAIAGIIIGSVAGILLLIWLIRTVCFLNTRDGDGYTTGRKTRRTVYDTGSRGRRRGSRGSSYVSYRAEKPGSRRYRDVQRPAKVYAV